MKSEIEINKIKYKLLFEVENRGKMFIAFADKKNNVRFAKVIENKCLNKLTETEIRFMKQILNKLGEKNE